MMVNMIVIYTSFIFLHCTYIENVRKEIIKLLIFVKHGIQTLNASMVRTILVGR